MVLIFILSFLLSLVGTSGNQTEVSIERGRKLYWLTCFEDAGGIDWKKDGYFIARNMKEHSEYLLISCAGDKDVGTYSCHNRVETEQALKTFNVKVKDSSNLHPCGKPDKDLIKHSVICAGYKYSDYPCCEDFAPPPRYLNVHTTFTHAKNECDLFENGSFQQPWRINIDWQLPYYGAKNVWGWQVRLIGKNGDLNYQHCTQINSKDEMLNLTIPVSAQLVYGATYIVVVQSLPSKSGDKGYVSNTLNKTFTTPTIQETCHKVGKKCKWEFCWPVDNLTVVAYKNNSAIRVSWLPSLNHKTVIAYELLYWSIGDCKEIKEIRTNKTQVIIDKNLLNNCDKYFLKVRPLFKHHSNGLFTNTMFLYTNNSDKTTQQPPTTAEDNIRKIIISCTVGIALCVVCGAVLLVIFLRRNKSRTTSVSKDKILHDDIEDKCTEVLIVHDNHCKLCNHVTHAIAYALNESGYIKCSLDICSINEIGSRGLSWYEEKLQSCDKVLIICTTEGKKIFETKDPNVDQSANMFKFNLKIIMGRIINYNYSHKVVPVYYDQSSHDDIPFFLSDRRSYALPQEFHQLILALINFNERSINADIQYQITQTSDMTRSINKVKTAMTNMIKNHKLNTEKINV